MGKVSISRFAVQTVLVAVAIVLFSAATALANPLARAKLGTGLNSAKVSNARALGGKCVNQRSKRPLASRRRCSRAAASRAGQPLYWGATIGNQLTGNQAPWDMNAVAKFEETARKPASVIQFFQPFAECGGSSCSFYSFPTTPMNNIRQHGAIPVLSWSSQSIPSSLNEPDFQLSDVIEGRYDSYISQFAHESAAWGHPFFLRFNWEMNGNWFPWSEGVNGNQPGEYVAAWRHVHDLFVAAGATNVSWVWCPFVDPGSTLQSMASD
jgi:hypothetical protein